MNSDESELRLGWDDLRVSGSASALRSERDDVRGSWDESDLR